MTVSAQLLRKLHRIHRQISDLRSRLDRGPRQLAFAQAAVKKAEEAAAANKTAHTQARVNADKLQLQLKTREDRISDLRVKLNTAANNREYQALLDQISADEQANSVLSDEIFECLEKIDSIESARADAHEETEAAKQELAKLQAKVGAEQEKLKGELSRVTAELKEAEKELTGDFRRDYLRISEVKGENSMAQVEGEVCGGCYQTITAQMKSELSLSHPVFCKSCGVLLYLPEDA